MKTGANRGFSLQAVASSNRCNSNDYLPFEGCGDGESACRRGSVQGLRPCVAIHLSGLPGGAPRCGRAVTASHLTLLPVGFTEPPRSPEVLVRSYRTVSPLPVPSRRPAIGGLFSVALSCESPRLAVSQHRCSMEPRPSSIQSRGTGLRPPGQLTVARERSGAVVGRDRYFSSIATSLRSRPRRRSGRSTTRRAGRSIRRR